MSGDDVAGTARFRSFAFYLNETVEQSMSFTTPAMLALRNALGVPSTQIPIDGTTFVSYVLPPVVCFFVVALLAVTPRTRTLRVALWPLTALLALRAALSVDMSLGKAGYEFNNTNFVVSASHK